MNVRQLIAGVLRRWYVLVAALLVTAGLCFLAFQKVPVSYEASGSSLLLPPKSSVGSRGNPYLYLGGLGQAVEVLSARLNASEVRAPIQQAHPDATFTAAQDTTTTGPIVKVTVTSSSSADSMATMQAVLTTIPSVLQKMQDDLSIPDGSRISLTTLTVDTSATAVTKTRDRAVIALAGVGLAGGVLLTGLVDGLIAQRGTRRQRKTAAAPTWESRPAEDPGTSPKSSPPEVRRRAPAGAVSQTSRSDRDEAGSRS